MAVHASHAALPYPIKGARFSLLVPYLDDDGDPTAPASPDIEFSKDNGAAADCAEEVSATSGMDGMTLMTLTGAETDASCVALNGKVASGPKATLATLYPRVLASVGTGTLSAGSAGGGTLGTLLAYDVTGCFIKTTGGTGGGGTGGANNQVRRIVTYNTSTGAFTVEPNWETTPSTDTTYSVLLPEGVTLGMLRALNPTTPGRTLGVESDGHGHADLKEWLGVAPAALTAQRVNSNVGAVGGDTTVPTNMIVVYATDFATNYDSTHDMWSVNVSYWASEAPVNGAVVEGIMFPNTMGTLFGAYKLGDTEFADITGRVDQLALFVDLINSSGVYNGLTSTRTGYLDNLNVGGNVASSAEVTAIQNNTRVVRVVPTVIERPDDGTDTYRIELFLYDSNGNMEAPDSAPTIALVNQAGTDRSSRLDSTTMTLVETGRYRAVYTADDADALEQLVWTFSVVEGGATRKYGNQSVIVDTTAVDFTAADRTKLEAIHGKLPSKDYLTGTANADGDVQMNEATGNFAGTVGGNAGDVAGKVLGGGSGTITGTGVRAVDGSGNAIATASALASTDGKVDTVSTNVSTLLSRITSTLFSGITSLANWLRAGFRKTNNDSTAVSEINANNGTGTGTYDPTTDAPEAIRDRGDAAWTTGGGGGGGGDLDAQDVADAMKLAPASGSPAAGSVQARLQAIEAKTGLITSGGIQVSNGSHVIEAGNTLQLVQGQKYSATNNNLITLSFTDARLPATIESDDTLVYLRIAPRKGTQGDTLALAGSISSFNSSTGAVTVTFEATSAQTASLRAGELSCIYEVDWHLAGDSTDVLTSQAEGPCTVLRHIA